MSGPKIDAMVLTIAMTVKPRAKTESVVKVNDGDFVVSVQPRPQQARLTGGLLGSRPVIAPSRNPQSRLFAAIL
jgi:hypothetical protein